MIASTLLYHFALAMLWLAIIHNHVTLWQATMPISCGTSQTALLNQVPNHCISFSIKTYYSYTRKILN
jgi:hypothetical protein